MPRLGCLLLVGLLGLTGGCGHGRSGPGQGNSETKADRRQIPIAADVDPAEECSASAREWFGVKFMRDSDTLLLSYRHHYNKNQSKCFIQVENHFTLGFGMSWESDRAVWDVDGDFQVGEIKQEHVVGEGTQDRTTLVSCEVQGQRCMTSEQFDALADPFMKN